MTLASVGLGGSCTQILTNFRRGARCVEYAARFEVKALPRTVEARFFFQGFDASDRANAMANMLADGRHAILWKSAQLESAVIATHAFGQEQCGSPTNGGLIRAGESALVTLGLQIELLPNTRLSAQDAKEHIRALRYSLSLAAGRNALVRIAPDQGYANYYAAFISYSGPSCQAEAYKLASFFSKPQDLSTKEWPDGWRVEHPVFINVTSNATYGPAPASPMQSWSHNVSFEVHVWHYSIDTFSATQQNDLLNSFSRLHKGAR